MTPRRQGATAANRIVKLDELLSVDIAFINARVKAWEEAGKIKEEQLLSRRVGIAPCRVLTGISGNKARLVSPENSRLKLPIEIANEKYMATYIYMRFQGRDAELRTMRDQMAKVQAERGSRTVYGRKDKEQTMGISHSCNTNSDKQVCVERTHMRVQTHGENLGRRFCISRYVVKCGNCNAPPIRMPCPHDKYPCKIASEQTIGVTLEEFACLSRQITDNVEPESNQPTREEDGEAGSGEEKVSRATTFRDDEDDDDDDEEQEDKDIDDGDDGNDDDDGDDDE